MRLLRWEVKRSGAGLAAFGIREDDGAKARISGIARIEPRGRAVFVTDKAGDEHELVMGGQSN